ncbi:polynucleotide kinase 3 phosphatase-domain-containing protein [Parasitella parasitica]|nr:polynucleotide kinase 3 phosphatase-domain-containing protein [Parasitella parasitica]
MKRAGLDTAQRSSKTQKKGHHPFFDMSPRKSALKWINALESVLIAKSPVNEAARSKIAAFDLDGTLISTKSGRVFAKDENDWRWWDPTIPKRIDALYNEGYKIVIFSNQNGLNSDKKTKGFQFKIEAILNQVSSPVLVMAATKKDKYRKPMTGMWEWLEQNNGDVSIDKSQSFYVGDAAGRDDGWKPRYKKDHSCGDRKFADNVNIAFYTPEEFFLKEPKAKFQWRGFNAKQHIASALPLYTPDSTPLVSQEDGKSEVVVCVGYPASGKSSFAKKYLVPKGYVYINQDTLKTRDRCIAACQAALSQKKSVVVDNTNPERATRALYIKLAQNAKASVRCFYFGDDEELSQHNNYYRAVHKPEEKRDLLSSIAFRTFKSKLQEPSTAEGFEEVKKINFVFDGPDSDKEAWQTWWH